MSNLESVQYCRHHLVITHQANSHIKNMAVGAADVLIQQIKVYTLLDIKMKNNRILDYTIVQRGQSKNNKFIILFSQYR